MNEEAFATKTAADTAYRTRFCRVLDFIDAHLDQPLHVDQLSRVTAYSKYHFHRQFSALFGIGVFKYVQLLRMKRASYELAFRDRRILEIAIASEYESHEAFTRAFKKSTGQSPSEFRRRPAWDAWHASQRPLNDRRSQHMGANDRYRDCDVTLIDFPETRVGVLEHRGDPARIGDSIRTFIEWRKANHLPPPTSATFNLLYGDPKLVPPEDFRLDLCAATPRAVAENPQGVVERRIPGGRCARLRHTGSEDRLGEAIQYLYATWLPASAEEPRDFPLFLQRVRFFPDVPENEAVVDIFLPLR